MLHFLPALILWLLPNAQALGMRDDAPNPQSRAQHTAYESFAPLMAMIWATEADPADAPSAAPNADAPRPARAVPARDGVPALAAGFSRFQRDRDGPQA